MTTIGGVTAKSAVLWQALGVFSWLDSFNNSVLMVQTT